MDSPTREKINELRSEVDQEWALNARKEYLNDLMAALVVQWWHERDLHSDYVARGRMIEDMMTLEAMWNILKKIVQHQREIYYGRKAMNGEQVGVTAEEIERAREHPWDDLLVFTHGKAICPFHSDHTPSFSVKFGKGKCWSCGWRGDQIDFWMQKNGRGFSEAVRRLS
jgi:hypothetical protein